MFLENNRLLFFFFLLLLHLLNWDFLEDLCTNFCFCDSNTQ